MDRLAGGLQSFPPAPQSRDVEEDTGCRGTAGGPGLAVEPVRPGSTGRAGGPCARGSSRPKGWVMQRRINRRCSESV